MSTGARDGLGSGGSDAAAGARHHRQAPDADYYASAKVWENKADFDARLAKLIKDIDENAPKAKNLDGLKDARAAIVQTCNSCHEVYRVKKS